MPFIEILEEQLRLFYICNPLEPVIPMASSSTAEIQDVLCAPLDPQKRTLLGGCRGLLSHSEQFYDPRLQRQFNIVAIAMKNHDQTESKAPSPPDEPKCYAEDLRVLRLGLARLELRLFVAFGVGPFGCYLAASLAATQAPDVGSVEALVLCSPGVIGRSTEALQAIKAALAHVRAAMGVNKNGRGDGTGTIPEEVLTENAAYAFGDPHRHPVKQRVHNLAFQLRYGMGHSTDHQLRMLFDAETNRPRITSQEYRQITCPCLIFAGTDDMLVSPLSAAEAWKAELVNARGGAQLAVIKGAPHLLPFTDAGVVNRMLVAFLERNP